MRRFRVSGRTNLYYKGEKMHAGHAQNADFHGYGTPIRKRLSDLIPRHEDLKVLDVGTGMATTARFLLEHLSTRSHVTSLDPSREVLTEARRAVSAEDRRRITFVRGSADDMKFDSGSFDVVVSVMVMHHIEAVDKSIAEMSRVLGPDGQLVVIDYSPKAHTLGFQSRHEERDFFEPEAISKAAKASRLSPRIENHGKWYLVEATKGVGIV